MTSPLTSDEAERRITAIKRQLRRAEIMLGPRLRRLVLLEEAAILRTTLVQQEQNNG